MKLGVLSASLRYWKFKQSAVTAFGSSDVLEGAYKLDLIKLAVTTLGRGGGGRERKFINFMTS